MAEHALVGTKETSHSVVFLLCFKSEKFLKVFKESNQQMFQQLTIAAVKNKRQSSK